MVLGALALATNACGETEVVDDLHLRITSEAPLGGGTLDGLGIVLRRGTTRFPANLADPAFNPALAGLDPVKSPVLISLKYDGQTFGDGKSVSLQVVGRVGQVVKTRVERTVDLGTDTIIELRLLAIDDSCDKDGDGFLDCSVAGCCSVGSPFADCNDNQVAINPWGSAPACVPCGSSFDYDCDGTVERCVDADADNIADCLETECGLGDATVGPGLPELCDGKDNDCDGSTDEGFALGGARIGEACTVTGECGAGVVECLTTTTVGCSSGPGGSQSKAAAEVCDGKDNDCDGSTDEDFTYEGAAIGQACEGRGECGAGLVECSATNPTRATCSTNADGSASEAQPEVCDGEDNDCDGSTDEGLTVADSDCVQVGVCQTFRHLIVATCNSNGTWNCNYAGVTGWQAVEDLCDRLDNDCDGDTDEGFTYEGAAVGEACEGRGECGPGVVVCANGRTDRATCSTNPGGNNSQATAEVCDGKDNDCDGDTDEGFSYFGVPIGGQCDGVGECGAGTVVCAVGRTDLATCSTNPNGTESQAISELCDGKDNDCDGDTDETFDATTNTCKNLGVCATGVIATCNTDGSWSCDYSNVANYQAVETLCDGLDNDCDGETDEGFTYLGTVVGQSCDGIGTCGAGTVVCAVGRNDLATCSTNPNGPSSQASAEICDGADNDCDGDTDEGFTYLGTPVGEICDGVGECGVGVVQCAVGRTDLATCSTNPNGSSSQAVAEICDAKDNDCDGDTDEGLTLADSDCRQVGVCAAALGQIVATCTTQGVWTCNYAAVPFYEADEASCDGRDNDCDGDTDEGFLYDGTPIGGVCDGRGVCGAGLVECAVGRTDLATCSTNPDGSDTDATTEICDGLDNDCDGETDEGFPDADDDGIADCVDDCLDLDGDEICVTPGLPPCVGGQTTNCSDNCPSISNPSQADADRDGIGDLCDLACPNGPAPYDVCGDCLDNNCKHGIDESSCVERRIITIQAKTEPLAAGYPVKLVLDHKTLVDAGFSLADGSDVRIFWRDRAANCDDADPLSCYVELDRVTDPLKPFNRNDTEIWFALQDDLDVGEATLDYEIYYNVDSLVKPPQDERAVFQFADFFERGASDTLGFGWNESNQAATDFAIADGRLVANYGGDAAFTPVITRAFDAISGAGTHGLFELRIGMNWLRNGEDSWAVLMQLGKGSALLGMPLNPAHWPNSGVGVSVAHGGGTSLGGLAANTVATVAGGIGAAPTFSSRGTLSAVGEIVVMIDFDSQPAPTYSVSHSGSIGEDLSTQFATAQTELDTIRIVLHNVANNFTSKAWDYLLLRPRVGALAEPDVYLGIKEPFSSGQATCELGPNRFLRYRMNERASNPEETSLLDTSGVGTPLNLARTTQSGFPDFLQVLQHWGVRFNRATTGRFRSDSQGSTTKLGTNVSGSGAMTFEVVVDNRDSGTRTSSVDWLALVANNVPNNTFGLGFVDRDTIEAHVRTGSSAVAFRWDVAQLPSSARVVLHLIYDSSEAAGSRVKLYYDGALLTPSVAPAISGNLSLYAGGMAASNARMLIGNSNDGTPNSSPAADIYWFAAYSRALTAEDVKKHTRILLKDDDAP